MMSVCLCPSSLSRNRVAIPRGFASGLVSGMFGIPVELENRTMTGVDALLKCGAEEREAASEVGVKVPFVRRPVACAVMSMLVVAHLNHCKRYDRNIPERYPAGVPKAPWSVFTKAPAVSFVAALSERGIFVVLRGM